MNRAAYLAGFGYIAVCGAVIYEARHPVAVVVPPQVVQQVTGSDAQRWFARVKANCNSVEVELQLRQDPAPSSTEGSGYAAAATRWPAASRMRARRSTGCLGVTEPQLRASSSKWVTR